MDDLDQRISAEIRRRRLDDLFADEPYLSTTMKARRLHEKLQELRAQENSGRGAPTETLSRERSAFAYPSSDVLSAEALRRQAVAWQAPSAPVDPNRLTLARAAEYLRAGDQSDEDEPPYGARLQRFRAEVLTEWLEAAPEREDQ